MMVNKTEVLLASEVEFGGRSFRCGEYDGVALSEP